MNEYEVDIDGVPHTVQYSDDEAKRLGLKSKTKQEPKPENKAVTVTKNK